MFYASSLCSKCTHFITSYCKRKTTRKHDFQQIFWKFHPFTEHFSLFSDILFGYDTGKTRCKTSCEFPTIQITADRRQPICCPAAPEQSARNMGRGVTLWLCRPSIRTRWWAGHCGNCLRNSVLTSQTGVSHHSSSTVMRCHLERAVESPHVYMQPGDPILPCIRPPLHSSHWFHFSRSHFADYHFELVAKVLGSFNSLYWSSSK